MDITEFLTARYDEIDALIARLDGFVYTSYISSTDDGMYKRVDFRVPIGGSMHSESMDSRFADVVLAVADPAHVLADIAAKRAIIADYLVVAANNEVERHNGGDALDIAARNVIVKTLRMCLQCLAAPYAEHPDFDPAWRIDA